MLAFGGGEALAFGGGATNDSLATALADGRPLGGGGGNWHPQNTSRIPGNAAIKRVLEDAGTRCTAASIPLPSPGALDNKPPGA